MTTTRTQLANSQHADQEEDFLNDWPCGTPKSFGSSFTGHLDGNTSMFAKERSYCPVNAAGASASQHATDSRERVEASGRNIGTIKGLSKKTALTQADATRYHVTVSQGA